MSTEDSSSRTVELEIQLAHLQRLFDQLNEVVTEQAQRMDQMHRTISKLKSELESVKQKSDEATDPLDEKPPHY